MDSALSIRDVYRASELLDDGPDEVEGLHIDAMRGRLSEFTAGRGHPQVTLAIERIAEVHRLGEPAAWIGPEASLFYPPDVADWGLDWSALAVLRLDDPRRALRAADRLLQSGAFGVVVIDLIGFEKPVVPTPLAGRLKRRVKAHDSALAFLTQTNRKAPSICASIGLRARARWHRVDPHKLQLQTSITRDKRRGPGQHIEEGYDGPLGLC